MSDPRYPDDPLPRLVQTLIDQAIPLLERIAVALERGASRGQGAEDSAQPVPPAGLGVPATVEGEVRVAVDEGRWDRAEAIVAGLAAEPGTEARVEALTTELTRARDRAIANLTDRIEAARLVNDAAGALAAHDDLAKILRGDDLKAVDRGLIGWLMKLIQRRLRSIPVGSDLATLATQVADRFGGTPEGASLRAALPTLRRSAGLCPRCAEPYLGVDDACPKCLALAGQAPTPPPTLTFVTDDLDAVVGETSPVDLNKVETWQIP